MSTKATVYMDFIEVQIDKHTKLRFSPGDGVIVPGVYIERDDGSYARVNFFAEIGGDVTIHLENAVKDAEIVLLPKGKKAPQ